LLSKSQIIVPIHINLKKLRTYFCARFRPGSLKVDDQYCTKAENIVISGLIRSLVSNTLIFIDASAT